MVFLIYPFNLPPANELNDAQTDGLECVYCPEPSDGPMKPVGRLRGTLVFAHSDCADDHRIQD